MTEGGSFPRLYPPKAFELRVPSFQLLIYVKNSGFNGAVLNSTGASTELCVLVAIAPNHSAVASMLVIPIESTNIVTSNAGISFLPMIKPFLCLLDNPTHVGIGHMFFAVLSVMTKGGFEDLSGKVSVRK